MNMRIKKLTLVLAVILIASTALPALAKSPFSDVPADHWAYDSIVELAAAGLIEGYPDGTFGGARMMTRYEGAMVFARALARLEGKIAETDILAELDQIKAELMEEIKAELAVREIPVETKILEKVIMEKDLDEAALKRIRANELNLEVLEGDLAYVENRVGGLIHGLRFDLDKLQEQLQELAEAEEPAVEVPSLAEIEELIAAQVEAGIKEAALSAKEVVKETTVIEKVIEEIEVDGLTEEDVELIAEALIAGQLQKYDILIDETRDHLYKIYTRLDEVEAAQAETAAAVKALEKVKLSGTLSFNSTNNVPAAGTVDEYGYSQGVGLNLNIKASDSVNVRTVMSGGIPHDAAGALSLGTYGVDVTSDALISRLAVGKKLVTNAEIGNRISGYALALPTAPDGKGFQFAGLADLDIAKGLTGNVLLGSADAGADTDLAVGLGLKYELMPELGLKAAFGSYKTATAGLPDPQGVYAGLFGEVFGVNYAGDFAMDLREESDNMLFGGSLSTKLGPVGLNGKYIMAQDDYNVGRPFIDGASANLLEVGADVEFLGINVDGGFYREAREDVTNIQAYRFGANTKFDLFVPISLSGEYAFNERAEENTHSQFKVALAPTAPDLGFRYGASFTMTKNAYGAGGNWKNGAFTGRDLNVAAANVGYKADVRGAILDLGYGATFTMPVEPEGDNKLAHKIDLGYNFTKDVKLTLGSSISHKIDEDLDLDWSYTAGLGISF